MTYTVGQNILNGQVVVASVDTDGLILSVVLPEDSDPANGPLTITYSAGVTEMFVANILAGIR